jgi:aryl carrier-like protein
MQAEMDRLRNQITSRKTSLRLAVRRLANEITDEQWRRLIETEQKQGETSLVFWLEKYRPRR